MLRRITRRTLEVFDRVYRRVEGLTAVGPMLFVGIDRRQAESRAVSRGPRTEVIAHLHFNNAQAAAVRADSRLGNGVRFARLLRHSLAELAVRARDDAAFRAIDLYEGVTWFAPHGRAVGFQSEPLPDSWRTRRLAAHFRLLVWAFSPTSDTRSLPRVAPRRFRITREALIENFARRTRERA